MTSISGSSLSFNVKVGAFLAGETQKNKTQKCHFSKCLFFKMSILVIQLLKNVGFDPYCKD